MIELVFLICLRVSPEDCEERALSYLPEFGLRACMMQAQPALAQWALAHPGYTVTRWHCRLAESRPIKA